MVLGAAILVRGDQVEEELVDAGVVAELGVEGGGEEMALTDQDGKSSRVARVSTSGPVRVMRGARMKTISRGAPGSWWGR